MLSGGGIFSMPRLGSVRDYSQDTDRNRSASGFVLYGNDGKPTAHFGFSSLDDAKAAHKKMSEIIAICKSLRGYASGSNWSLARTFSGNDA
jgi:hypothetical protein